MARKKQEAAKASRRVFTKEFREEAVQMLFDGHSAKSVARELRIAPGTVMVHKRNLFAKLGITSQYELFPYLSKNYHTLRSDRGSTSKPVYCQSKQVARIEYQHLDV